MNSEKINEFLMQVNKYTEQEIMENIQYINEYFRNSNFWLRTKEYIEDIVEIVEIDELIYELFKDEDKFLKWNEKLDISDKIKFGLEIEVAKLPLDAIKYAFDTETISEIMRNS